MRSYMLILLMVTAVLISSVSNGVLVANSQEPEFPHIEASKTVTPERTVQGGTIQFRIQLKGAGGMIRTPVDVVLVLDRSGSMTGRKIEDAKKAAITFLTYTDVDDRVGLVTYSNTIHPTELHVMDPDGKAVIESKIRDQQAGGSTNIYDSIATAEQILLSSPRVNAPLVIILLTDGLHNWPSLLPDSAFQAQAEEAKSRGIIIYTIGLGHDANKERLRMIAEITDGDFYFAATSEELERIYMEIGEKLAFAGTNIRVTETIPPYIIYNNDASKTPAEQSGDTLVWTIGHLKVGQEWEVTYTATAGRAVEINPDLIMARVEYTTAIGSAAIINLPPGLIYHDIALSDFIVDPLKVFEGEIISSQFTAHNRGIQQESFVLRIQFDGMVLDSRSITLGAGDSLVINFDWNTTGVDDGKYNLTVIADPDETIWETDRSDNQVSQQVEVKVTAGNLWFFIIIFLLVMILTTGGIAYVKMKPAVTRPTEPTYVCPNCRSALQYNPRIGQWYCYKCRRYYRERQPSRPF